MDDRLTKGVPRRNPARREGEARPLRLDVWAPRLLTAQGEGRRVQEERRQDLPAGVL